MGRVRPAADLAGQLAGVPAVEPDDGPLVLGDLWRERAVVLVHLRHFG